MATGKRAAARRGPRPKATFNRPALLFALAITGCLIAWGYLVYLAIDFGTSARSGETGAWGLLALASLGAVACLFAGLLFVARLLRALGITKPPRTTTLPRDHPPRAARPVAGAPPADASSTVRIQGSPPRLDSPSVIPVRLGVRTLSGKEDPDGHVIRTARSAHQPRAAPAARRLRRGQAGSAGG
ncbi:hypothetical protein [Nocardioides piscis]|uniref:Uncharacterized protein n=1 Tax=Nocardioides piscis TaxID=2714938 RepID=A0A6G7YBT2_9ACTN|nr:hypothetical protein [Nocardioides piscis]QIK74364.1 hypothetical protein G7071_01800 [Nocardioides piscis]